MRLSIISFTEKGRKLAKRIAREADKVETDIFTAKMPVGDWAKTQIQKNAMLFIGACGIAVRAVAPYVKDKLNDSPVLVMDEEGRYVIPILSGHMGGANELAVYLSEKTGAEPVITTATDINKRFAVDMFAKKNGLSIINKEGIVKVSSKVLAGKEITMSIEPGHYMDEEKEDCPPEGVRIAPYPPAGPVDVLVSAKEDSIDSLIRLEPKEYIIGLGCRRGKKSDEIEKFIHRCIGKLGISMAQIFALSSVSQKQKEQGIVLWCQKERIPFITYTAEELREVKGNFKESSFVEAQVGVDNVCERAAVKACGPGGVLICRKYAEDGMTIAIAKREWKVRFYGE